MLSLSPDGTVRGSFLYGAFGEVVASSGSKDHRRQFNGKENDASTGWRHYGFRSYDPLLLRWTSSDPLYRFAPDWRKDEPQRANLYAFTGNNPLRYVDPDGREPEGESQLDLPEDADPLLEFTYAGVSIAGHLQTTHAMTRNMQWLLTPIRNNLKEDSSALEKTGAIAYGIVLPPLVVVAFAAAEAEEVVVSAYHVARGIGYAAGAIYVAATEGPSVMDVVNDLQRKRDEAAAQRKQERELREREERERDRDATTPRLIGNDGKPITDLSDWEIDTSTCRLG
ncbi:MAG: RHS repeat-associated core domain-containing protein [Pseudomonadota bacterium]|nr:RHS repeat-associated core domain-containing protein [Pseudomonadota bacterium]